MSKIIAASTLALAISMGGAFWGNGAQASTSSAKLQTQQWMWSISALSNHGSPKEKENGSSEEGVEGSSDDIASDGK